MTTRCRCRKCGNMYTARTVKARKAKKCGVCNGTATSPNGNRITGRKNHFYIAVDVGEGKSVTAHVNMNPNAGPEVLQAVNEMVKIAYHKL